ncbi:ultraviolet-sensitive, Opsin [Lucilia cuprina]|nr:ultraviolet-sensitive, Opsin [Lucilia cuprina]
MDKQVLLSLLSLVKANSLAQNVEVLEHDLVVCLPNIYTNSCTIYVNSSSINGLIELNESVYPALKGFRGSYDYKMIARINPFWLTFEPPSDTSYYIMGTLYTIIFVFGVTGNGLVIYMFAKCKALRTTSNILVFNLSLSDLMIVIKCPVAIYNNFMRGPALGDWGCRLYAFAGGFSGTASICLLTVISVDRYSVVVNPLSPLRFNYQSKYYYFLVLLAWSEAFFFSVIPLLEVGLSVYVPEGYLTTCSFDYLDKTMPARVFMFLFFFFAWCIPLMIIFYCYFHILRVVFKSKKIQCSHNKQKVEERLAFIVLLIIGLWFLAWTPYSIVAMAGVFGMEEYLTPDRSMVPALFCKTAACLNPFLYTISHKRFRNELQRLFCKRKPIYQYSMTRSSYISRSTRRNRIDPAVLGNTNAKELEKYRNNLKSKISIDNATISGVVNCSLYGAGEAAADIFHKRKRQKKSLNLGKKQISPEVSSEEPGIFVLELDDYKTPKTQPSLETNF